MEVTLITGASGGIGKALAVKFAEKKHNLLLVARSAGKLEKLCRQLVEKYHIKAEYITADLVKAGAPEYIFTETQKRKLNVNVLVNNAGIGSGGEFTTLSLKSELDMLQLNNSALVALTHYFLPQMQQQKQGTVINVASMAAFMPAPYMAVYAASKVFVRSFTEAITEECKPYNIYVMLLCPGLTQTNFMNAAGISAGKQKALTGKAKTQTPEEVANEAIKGLDAGKAMVICGRTNRIGAKAGMFISNATIAKIMAKSYRKNQNA